MREIYIFRSKMSQGEEKSIIFFPFQNFKKDLIA